MGRAEETETHIAEALRLGPRDPFAYVWMTNAGAAKYQLGAWNQAVEWSRRAIESMRIFPLPHFVLGGALAQLDRMDEARAAVKTGLAIIPSFTVSRVRADATAKSHNPTYLAQVESGLEGLRKAGVPE
jgi:tetratricopeptide (TPR) repeat protein